VNVGRRVPAVGILATMALVALFPVSTWAQVAWPAALDSALGAVDLTTETARFDLDAARLWGGDRYATPIFQRVYGNPWLLPATMEREAEGVVDAGESLFELLRLATLKTGQGVYRGIVNDAVLSCQARVDSSNTPLIDALFRLYDLTEVPFLSSQEQSLAKEVQKLTPEMKDLLACFVHSCSDWLEWRKIALRKVSTSDTGLRKVLPLADPGLSGIFQSQSRDPGRDMSDLNFVQWYDFIERIDMPFLYTGALDLAAVCEWIADSAKTLGIVTAGNFTWDTPLGRLSVGDKENDTYGPKRKHLFILDSGGDDTVYNGGATISMKYHTGVIIDLQGNDVYRNDESLPLGVGGALLGVALVYDLEGDDTYEGNSRSLGCGIFGVGGVIDRSGNDTYSGYHQSQGSGSCGVGVLADLGGDDRYMGVNQIQGFGYVLGCGILYDASGADVYEADDTRIDFPSEQSDNHNTSLAQGVGFGLRADLAHGHSLAGGVGYLVDGGGDDSYSAGVFAQGCAYWHAFGMLADLGGTDDYRGAWYVQGSAAHFAVGALYDVDGDDVYHAELNMAQGAGHDFSTGFLWDGAGNDTYNAPEVSLGAGNANGLGVLRDDAGNDTYNVSADVTLGRANSKANGSIRYDLLCLGVFLDLAGTDIYPAGNSAIGNRLLWLQVPPQDGFSPWSRGVGLDRAADQ
jgi:hypothetical protein